MLANKERSCKRGRKNVLKEVTGEDKCVRACTHNFCLNVSWEKMSCWSWSPESQMIICSNFSSLKQLL